MESLLALPAPGGRRALLARDGEWREVGRIDLVRPLRFLPPGGDRVLALDPRGKGIVVHRWVGGELRREAVFQAPRGMRVHALAARGDALYLGGHVRRGGRESLWVRDLRTGAQAPVPLPEETYPGKAIDALLVDGDRLIAVDDIVFPKWYFVYDIGDPLRPRAGRSIRLPGHYSYERVLSSALCGDAVATLSSGVGRAGRWTGLSLCTRETLDEAACITLEEPAGRFDEPDPGGGRMTAVVAGTGAFLLPAGSRGVAVVDVPPALPDWAREWRRRQEDDRHAWLSGPGDRDLSPRFVTLPGSVDEVIPVPGARRAFAVIGEDAVVFDY
jgi:hypothetical protein